MAKGVTMYYNTGDKVRIVPNWKGQILWGMGCAEGEVGMIEGIEVFGESYYVNVIGSKNFIVHIDNLEYANSAPARNKECKHLLRR